MVEKRQFAVLRLVYPPVSNQEGDWIAEDPEVEAVLSQSKLYMIGQRREIRFANYAQGEGLSVVLDVTSGAVRDRAIIDVASNLARHPKDPRTGYDIDLGPKICKIWAIAESIPERTELLNWFTTEKLLYDRWRQRPGVLGLDKLRNFTEYELLYVGIAPKQGSYRRLLELAHEKRLKILSNAYPKEAGSRVTDEVILFFWRIDAVRMHTGTVDRAFASGELPTIDEDQLVADAEKAFVSLFKPEYNTIRYSSYPQGRDGLAAEGLLRYGYAIDEDVTLHTAHARIRGGYSPTSICANDADLLAVEQGKASILSAADIAAICGTDDHA